MKKMMFTIALLLALMVTLAGCSPAADSNGSPGDTAPANSSGDDTQVYELTYAGTVPDTHPITIAFNKMAEDLEARTNGRIIMKLYPNNTLGDPRSNIESMQNNSVQMGECTSSVMAIFTTDYMAMGLPFLFESYEQAYAFADTDFMKELADKTAEDLGVRPVGWLLNGARALTNNKHAVVTPDDMKGLKIRVLESDLYINIFETLGSVATPMSFAEVFTGLQQKTIDGQDMPSAIVVSNQYYEVQSYFTDLNHVIDLAPVLVSDEWYQSLPEDLRQIFDEVVAETVAYERQMLEESVEADFVTIAENGCEVTRLTDEQRGAFKDACASVYDWFAEQYPDVDVQSYIDVAASVR